ncbi:ABC-F family ATP-binding cassette domain-containing protein [Paenibacillus sp. CMAA1364]
MNILTVEHISKSYGEKILFQDASFGMEDQDKIGIVGVNGTGKSTLLQIIAGLEKPDGGQISIGNGVRVRTLAQNPDYDPEMTVLQQVFQGNDPQMKVVADYTVTMDLLDSDPSNEKVLERLLDLNQEMDTLQAWNLESEAKIILNKLGITQFEDLMGTLSGGQRKRVALANALIQPCELLILDEPTNHIDTDSVAWLEQYLQKRRGALLMITDDRYFLDRVANVMLELDYGRLFRYQANYSAFLELKAEREEREASTEHKRQNLLRTELAWMRKGPKARSTKQKARIDRYEELKDTQGIQRAASMDMSVASSRLGRKILEIDHLHKTNDGIVLIQDFNYIAVPEDRVGIVGSNGTGKSTLLNLIAGRLQPDGGEISVGTTVKIGYFTQEHQEMNEKQRVIEYIKDVAEVIKTADGSTITAGQMLERFLFSPTLQWTPISKLSGGEKRRLYLLRVLMGAPNVLLLDEPTNDLDIQTLAVLEQYLDDFPGVVIVVSHDRYFLDRTVDKIVAFEGGGNLRLHVGSYTEYEEWMAKNVPHEADRNRDVPSVTNVNKSNVDSKKDFEPQISHEKVKFSFKEKREYDQIDEMIQAAEQNIVDTNQQMELHFNDSAKLQELMVKLQLGQQELEQLMERWTYLNEIAEKMDM